MSKVNHLVVDAPAFLKNVALQDLSSNIYTVVEVVSEIRDRATRDRLHVLPYEINFREPQAESLKIVTEFSKKTGDYFALSATDMRILALTYELHVQHVGEEGIRSEPQLQLVGQKPWEVSGLADKQLPGFYNPNTPAPGDTPIRDNERSDAGGTPCDTSDGENRDSDDDDHAADGDEEDEDYEEDDGWIAPDNYDAIVKEMGVLTVKEDRLIEVGCLTTDFAMQNTLIQLGLSVISVDGMLIKQPKVFILRCFGCYKTTTKMESKFCGHCGNKTMKRVAVSLDEDGTKHVHINFRRPINARGTRFGLPTPKGGHHAVNPILCADQPTNRDRCSRLAHKKTDALGLNYVADSSPFAVNDIYSRSAMVRGRGKSTATNLNRKNPNVVVKHFGSRKK